MTGRLELRRWLNLGAPLHAVALSSDGQFVAVGSERGPLLFNAAGEAILRWATCQIALPVCQVALSPSLDWLYVGTRTGEIMRLALEHLDGHFTVQQVTTLHVAKNDVYAMSVSQDQQWIAIGHLAPALTVLSGEGELHWRRHPDDGTATESDHWSVAIDPAGQVVYVGSASSGSNRLAAIGLSDRRIYGSKYLAPDVRATALAALPDGVVVVQTDNASFEGRLIKFSSNLVQSPWVFAPEDTITAVATAEDNANSLDAPLVAIACGYEGRILLLDAGSGTVVAETILRAGVSALALAQGRVAAVTHDDTLALLHYVPEEFRI